MDSISRRKLKVIRLQDSVLLFSGRYSRFITFGMINRKRFTTLYNLCFLKLILKLSLMLFKRFIEKRQHCRLITAFAFIFSFPLAFLAKNKSNKFVYAMPSECTKHYNSSFNASVHAFITTFSVSFESEKRFMFWKFSVLSTTRFSSRVFSRPKSSF